MKEEIYDYEVIFFIVRIKIDRILKYYSLDIIAVMLI